MELYAEKLSCNSGPSLLQRSESDEDVEEWLGIEIPKQEMSANFSSLLRTFGIGSERGATNTMIWVGLQRLHAAKVAFHATTTSSLLLVFYPHPSSSAAPSERDSASTHSHSLFTVLARRSYASNRIRRHPRAFPRGYGCGPHPSRASSIRMVPSGPSDRRGRPSEVGEGGNDATAAGTVRRFKHSNRPFPWIRTTDVVRI